MKSLKDYLVESKKTYAFKIGIAGELPKETNEHLKHALEKFSVAKLSSGKKTPIQEQPLDFPNLQNMEVTYWDVEVNYPTTESVLQEYLSNFCRVPRGHVIVRNPNSPVELQKETKDSETYDTLLTNSNLGGESAQSSVGNNRVMDLLKELETARKERNEQSSDFKIETLNAESQNNKSVVGK